MSDPATERLPDRSRRGWLAGVLTLAAPGAGQLYAGRPIRGILLHFTGYVWASAALVFFARGPTGAFTVFAPLLAVIAFLLFVAINASRSTRHATRFSRRARWLSVGALVLFSATASDRYLTWLKAQVGEAFRVTASSMEPTLVDGDYVFIAPQRVADLRRDQLVVWNDTSGPRLHRLIGLPGDTLQMRGTQLLRNGSALTEPYVRYTAGIPDSVRARTWGPLVVPPDSMFLLGDHRDNSYDSRYFGFVPLGSAQGRAARIYFSRNSDDGVRWSRIGVLLDVGVPTA